MQNFALHFRPKNLDEICDQEKIANAFKKFIKNCSIPHSIFFGSAGCGKTSFARALANEIQTTFFEFDAANLKIEEIRKLLSKNSFIKPLIFIDEIHRLSKTQQEALLIPMENYEAIFIGASTENPYYTLTSAIRSRTFLFEFKQISNFDKILENVKKEINFTISDEAKNYLFHSSSGDARAMLNLLEFALNLGDEVTLENLKILRSSAIGEGAKSDETHYNLASALIKSMRGSDIDASLYYLARLINSAESPDFIARRMVIFASEDIGNANPNALNLATNCLLAVKNIGYPEARIILSQTAVYLASSPKSNSSYKAINKVLDFVKNSKNLEIPKYLINNSSESKKYLYPHDFGGFVKQDYLSENLKFYESNAIGFEKTLNEWQNKIKGILE